ncbi:hypothetical protein LTR56_001213 [Elasticomyces elasticus]|nr:hypothetical protein LTR56_001213 [Elasticomyces elasticus]KAK3667396.1 hypothetical protein LTR22_001573 [Elasticomyces elasticus]KAK4915247.1 hypothetical protein LTR49_016644 [Elasticomyces elasticus]KAK5760535.1 hypothetical protein LTS12_009409 [Elasticomyces elasticus]
MSPDGDATAITITQNSALLKLAPELRNAIYEYAVQDTTLVTYRQRAVLYTPALGSVCRQIREEYKNIYKASPPLYARKIEVQITNFDYNDVNSTVNSFLHQKCEGGDSLPAGPRTIVRVCIILTNAFTESMRKLRHTFLPKVDTYSVAVDYEYRAVFDHATFDVDVAVLAFQKEDRDWKFGKPVERRNRWKKIERAFSKALGIYCMKCGRQ